MYGRLQLDSHAGHQALSAAQCGLCAHFGRAYRMRTRLLAGVDPSLLVLLAEGLAPASEADLGPTARVRCPLTLGLRKKDALAPDWPPLVAIAALQVVLAAEKLRDDVRDRDGTLARLGTRLLAADVVTAEATLVAVGFPLGALQAALAAQAAHERDAGADLDTLARPTAEALGLIAGWLGEALALGDEVRARLGTYGRRFGRTLYMVDALEDFGADRARGVFNPLAAALGGLTPARWAFVEAAFAGLTEALGAAFEALPLMRHAEPLRAATVEGLAARGRRALIALMAER